MTDENLHNTLIERLRVAQDIVERARLDDALKPAAFTEAFRLLNERHVDTEDRRAELNGRDDRDRGDSRPKLGLRVRLSKVAEAFRVDGTIVEQLFAEDGDDLLFVLPPRRLTNSTRGAMRQIAILTACARQAGGWDDAWTTSATLRAACENAHVYSSKHFSSVVSTLDMFATRNISGAVQFRAHAASYQAARIVLTQVGLLDEEENS